MAKGRMINRSISIDPKFNLLSMEGQWLYMRMLPFMDDYGRLTGNLFELKNLVIPSIETRTPWINGQLREMVKAELIYFKHDVCVQFRGFDKNQKIGHRKAESRYPDISTDGGKGSESFKKSLKGSNNIIKDNTIKDKKNKIQYKNKPRDLQMVVEYFKSKKIPDYDVNAKKFYDHYEASGWYRGKTKIKNWKMCLSSWEFNNKAIVGHPFESNFKKTTTGLYLAWCSRCGNREMPTDKWQLREGSNCCRVEYVSEKKVK